jgi:UPF0042 nucleotide-binding protein
MSPAQRKKARSRKLAAKPAAKKRTSRVRGTPASGPELVIITGMSGSGKASVLKAFEDLGFYCVDNLPVELIPSFAELIKESRIERTALVVDIREGEQLSRLPNYLRNLKQSMRTRVIFLEAADDVLVRRFSETRRPHPLGKGKTIPKAINSERERLGEIRSLADFIIDTSKFNVHDLRAYALEKFRKGEEDHAIAVNCLSFGYRNGVPQEADLLFDVRFLPNPHFIPDLRPYTGKHPKVARFVRSFPQTREFIERISKLLIYLLPHYVREGKSYLTIGFGCTGGKHRSVMIAEEVRKRLAKAGYNVNVTHRDVPD